MSRLHALFLISLTFGATALPVCAQEAKQEVAAPAPATPWSEAAATLLPLLEAEDDAPLREFESGLSPWLICDHLLAIGHRAGALRFARVQTTPDTTDLIAYLEKRSETPADPTARAALEATVGHILTERYADAYSACDGLELTGEDVATAWLLYIRAQILADENRALEAVSDSRRCGEIAERIGWTKAAFEGFDQSARMALQLDRMDLAVVAFEKSVPHAKTAATQADWVGAMVNVGSCLHDDGRSEEAIPWLQRGVAATDELDPGEDAKLTLYRFNALSLLGRARHTLMQLPLAVSAYEDAVALEPHLPPQVRFQVAIGLRTLGQTRLGLGLFEESLDAYARSEALFEAIGEPAQAAISRAGSASTVLNLGHAADAVVILEEVIATLRGFGADDPFLVRWVGTLALAYEADDRIEDADRTFRKASAMAEAAGNAHRIHWVRLNHSRLHLNTGRYEDAVAPLEAAIEEARRSGNGYDERHASMLLATAFAGLERWDDSIDLARRAVDIGQEMMRGLGDAEAAKARTELADAYKAGTYSALQSGDGKAAMWFLESSRSMAFLEMLGARRAALVDQLPEDLLAEVETARAAVVEARRHHASALRRERLKELREAAAALDEAEAAWATAQTRLERAGKRNASLAYPDPTSIDEALALLRPGEAIVLYGARLRGLCALVLEHGDEARLIDLGERDHILAPAARLTRAAADAAEPAPGDDLNELRARLLESLELGEGVTRLLISPYDELCYVPFARLVPDLDVALIPSATVLARLRDETSKPGVGVLALGDPDYTAHAEQASDPARTRGMKLTRLPGTADEVRTIAGRDEDVPLLHADATEAGFRTHLAKRDRWETLHFACHGLVDLERPTLSSLALTPDDQDDGFLTALEITGLELATDLVVLSACETGRGELHASEGIVGLTRSFMLAGAPRVICSLWKVDDAATAALMKRFYELRREGRSAAAALRGAQQHVRAREGWEHPAYWAAWVLWGLPE